MELSHMIEKVADNPFDELPEAFGGRDVKSM